MKGQLRRSFMEVTFIPKGDGWVEFQCQSCGKHANSKCLLPSMCHNSQVFSRDDLGRCGPRSLPGFPQKTGPGRVSQGSMTANATLRFLACFLCSLLLPELDSPAVDKCSQMRLQKYSGLQNAVVLEVIKTQSTRT